MKIAAAAVLASFTAVLAGSAAAPSATLAKVNDETVTASDVLAEFVKLHGGHAKFLGGEVEARAFLDKVVDRKLLIQEAYRLGLDQQDDIKKAVDDLEETKALEYLIKTEIDDKAAPTEEEIRTAWERNTSVLYEMREITLPTREEADVVYVQLLGGADFDATARACSTSPSRIYGGKLPLIGWGALDPPVEEVALALAPGDTAPPVKSASGWEIIRMEDLHPAERPEFDKAKMKIEGILKKRKLEARRRELSDQLFAKYRVKTTDAVRSPEALAEALAKAPDSPAATWDGGALAVKDFVSKSDLDLLGRVPPARAEEHVSQLLRQTVNDRLLRREAKERKIGEVPAVAGEVTRRREDLMEAALYADYVLKDLAVTDADARAEFDAHRADWTTPERRRVAHVLVATKEEAIAARKRLDAGESFGEVAKQVSIDAQTKTAGGDLGWITKKDVPAAFSAVLTMAAGAVTEPIESKFGWHLIKVVDVEAPI
ncbi:MAG TPA: peptidylprolyl isomerase, partial [Thermoanaerobaculia bacterium]|nr:peptidylprolyl isomerase [Thermoanaerobaculia bacterium]